MAACVRAIDAALHGVNRISGQGTASPRASAGTRAADRYSPARAATRTTISADVVDSALAIAPAIRVLSVSLSILPIPGGAASSR